MNNETRNIKTFLPDFCNARTLFVVILLAELLAIVLTLSQPLFMPFQLLDLAMNSLFIQWITLLCTVILCAFRKYFDKYSNEWVATVSYGITLLVTFVFAELTWWIFILQGLDFNFMGYQHSLYLLRIMGISAIAWALALRYFYIQHQYRQQIEAESKARYQALQSRIKPHFLFNCLNTIASLIPRQPTMAEQALEDLADLFRVSLQDTRRRHTMQEELGLCKRYLRVELHRLGQRLKVEWNIPDLPDDIQLPVLCLQPLLENAIYHGIEPLHNGGTVRVTAVLDDHRVLVSIENPLPPDQAQSHHKGNQLAQENIRQRLTSFFNENNLLQVEQTPEAYKVTVIIPILNNENSDR